MIAATEKKRRYKFSGHQTFVFRYGWLEKGVRGVDDSPTIFSDDDAMIRLGVGKNMVESIRHWCFVTQLVEADSDPEGKTGRDLRVTDLGRHLLLKDGWDPFLQDDASLWLIHWLLVSNPENSVIEYVEELADISDNKFVLDETAGMKQIFRRQERDPMGILNDYYCGGKAK